MSDPPFLYVVPPTVQIEEACIPGTRQTIFATIQTWLTSPDLSASKVLWLADISGSGKSAVARHVAYTTTLQNQLLCSFFFKRDIEPQSSTSRVISTLAREIARIGGPIASEIAQSSRDANGLGYTEAFHTQITLPLCHHPPVGPSLILIDALDESGTPTERAEFLAALVHEIPLLPDNVKLMVTSKPAQDIDDAFNKLSAAVSEEEEDDHEVYRLTFDVYGQENRRDLRRYISYTFDRVARLKRDNGTKLPENWPSSDERKSLVAHANGLFLWVSVAADYVACADDPQQALDKLLALQSRPSPEAAIDALYKHILRAADESPDFNLPTYHDVLDLVLASSNPITITEINLTLRRDAGPTIACLRPVLSCEPVVRIVHQSFREYVRDAQKCESRFLITWGTPMMDANPPPLVGSPGSNPQRKESFGSGLYPGFPLPSLATVASYPHAQHQAPDVSELIDINSISPHPAARGAYGDIWRARYTDGTEIAIKSIRVYGSVAARNRHKLEKSSVTELVVWSRLKHPNVLGLLGICVFAGEIGMVSEWMPNGNVTDYIAKHPEVDKLKLILDLAAGLSYLHSNGIVHGDLKGGNVVIAADGTGRLVDFGLARLTEESLGVSTTSTQSGTTRWMAHELISPAEGLKASATFASDVYALGMTILEILTGHPPFNELRNDFQVMFAVIKGDLPRRPSAESAPQLSDRLWELIEWCWHRDRERRPKAEVVYEMIKILYAQINRKPKEVLVDLRGMSCQGGPGPNHSVRVPYPENDDDL